MSPLSFGLVLFNQSYARRENCWKGKKESAGDRTELMCDETRSKRNHSAEDESYRVFVGPGSSKTGEVELDLHSLKRNSKARGDAKPDEEKS